MSYEHRSNINRKRLSTPLKTVIAASLLLLILNFFAPQFLSSFFTAILRPFWGTEKEITLSKESENAMIAELQKENNELKIALNRETASTTSTVLAHILKKPPFSAYDIYIIDIGTAQNVHAGDKVYALGDILLGEIAEANGNTSKVKLYSSYGTKYSVLIGKNIEATALGKGGGAFEIILPRDAEVNEGDRVTVPGYGGMLFGIVRKIIINPAKTFSTILFSQPVNIYEQRIVLVKKFTSDQKFSLEDLLAATDKATSTAKTAPKPKK